MIALDGEDNSERFQNDFKSIYRVIGIKIGAVEQNALRLIQIGDAARKPNQFIVLLCVMKFVEIQVEMD